LAAVGAGGTLVLAAVGAGGPVVGQLLGAFGAAGDGDHPPLGCQPAFGVELDHGAVAERLDLLGPAQPRSLLAMGATRSRELALVERDEHRVQRRRARLASAPAGRRNGALPDRLGVCGLACPARGG